MKTKIVYAIASILIAFGLWMYVINTVSPESYETISGIPVVFEGENILNEDRNLMITRKNEDTVSLSLSGNRIDLSKVNKGNIAIKVDLSKIYEPGQTTLQYTPVFPGDVPSNAFVIEAKSPQSITVTVEERRNKEVPLEIKWSGSTPEGFMSDKGNAVLDYPTIKVVGPASVADQIEKAVIEVDLTDRKESISESYRYTLCDKDGNPVDAELITTNVEEVRLDLKIARFKDIKIAYNLVEGGGANTSNTDITLNVESIRVSGSEAALKDMGDQLVVGTVNLRDILKDEILTFPISLPEGVNNLTGVTEVTMDIKFNGLTSREFVIEDLRSINVPEGMEAEIIVEQLTVTVRGPAAAINNLDSEDLAVAVDLTDAEAGTSTYKGNVIFPEGFERFGALGTISVSATVTKAR